MTTALALAAALALSACSREAPPAPEAPRPVRTMTVGAAGAELSAKFSGEIRARHETRLSFRIPGKIIERKVNVGDEVRQGSVLMRLDTRQESLQVAASEAELSAARARVGTVRSELERVRKLRERNFASQAEMDQVRQTLTDAEAQLRAVEARRRANVNQEGFAELQATASGAVTAVSAEVGQVVSAGQPVVVIAQAGDREVLISVPESRLREIQDASEISVTAWAVPDRRYRAELRELAPDADVQTHAWLARVRIIDAAPELRLGMTASVTATAKPTAPTIELPLSAIVDQEGRQSVWVLDRQTLKVHARAVEVAQVQKDSVLLKDAGSRNDASPSGLKTGEIVVIAGAHLLHEGQEVREEQAARGAKPTIADSARGAR